ncbi:hypothetical protein R0J91_15630, partial [Micrococcus sp. SIMBA_131]
KMAEQNIKKAHYTKARLEEAGVETVFNGAYFNEFVIKVNGPIKELNRKLLTKGIIGGYDLGRDYPELNNHMLVAVTENRTKAEIDMFVEEVG